MNTAVVLFAVLGAAMAQVRPVAQLRPVFGRVAQPVVHVSQPSVVHVAQPSLVSVAQPSLRVAAVENRRPIAIVRQSADQSIDGTFNYDFESENGISASAQGSVKPVGQDLAQVVQGSYSYTAPDGTPITVNYVADENGFHAEGAHLPVAPPVPEEIRRSLEILPTLEEFERQEAARQASQRRA